MIYLDNAATTACLPEVVDAMLPFFRGTFANASSIDHLAGTMARRAVDAAREDVAGLVGARPEDVIFTSGSTEANNLALSVACRVLTTPVEHPSILDAYRARHRNDDVLLRVDGAGCVELESLHESLDEMPALLAVIATNNETGAEQDVSALQRAMNGNSAFLHLDATQALLTRELTVKAGSGIDSAAVSAHKLYGPKGVGALIAGTRVRKFLSPRTHGGGHERGLRSGTLNVPGIIGFGVAARAAVLNRSRRRARLSELRLLFLKSLEKNLGEVVETTIPDEISAPHIASIRIPDVNSRALLGAMHGEIAFSLGSACATNKSEPSHVLLAIGKDKRRIAQTFRVSFAADQLDSDIVSAAALIASAADRLRAYSVSA